MVIFVHSIEPFYLDADGTYIASSGDALWVTLLDSAARCAVPLFVLTAICSFPSRAAQSASSAGALRK